VLTINIATPKFDREAGDPEPGQPPATPSDWEALRRMTREELQALGCGCWDGSIMLFPAEWYDSIPAGFFVVNVFDRIVPFEPGKTSRERRSGYLAYGVRAADGKDRS